jgi:tetratricopeptide (TPR) repeat protein
MMFRNLLFLGLLFFAHCSAAQDIDLIHVFKRDVEHAKNDNQRYDALNKLSWEFRTAFPDSGIFYAQKALEIGRKLGRKDIAKPLNFIGVSNTHKGDNLAAYDFFKQALSIAEENNDFLQTGYAHNNIGRLFMEQGLLDKAFKHLVLGKNVFNELNDLTGLAYSFQGLGGYYRINRQWKQAEENYIAALNIRIRLGDKKDIVSAQLQLGKFYMSDRKIDLALEYFLKADSIEKKLHDLIATSETKVNIGECLFIKGDLENAEKIVDEGLSNILRSKNIRLLPEAYLTMGQILNRKGDLRKAKEYFTKTLEVSTSRQDLNIRLEAYFSLWQTDKMEITQQPDLRNYENYVVLKDSIRRLEAWQRESQFQFQLVIERKESENLLLKIRGERKTAVILVLIVLVLSAIVILYQLIRNKRRVLQKNRTLENHMTTLVEFSKNRSISVGNLAHAAKDIVSITAKKLQVSQVSIWIYHEDEGCIKTLACYNLEQNQYVDNGSLAFRDAPHYFDIIKKERVIIAEDARSSAATCEFTESYFIPNNIFSLLDVTFFLDGHLKGLLCCEQQHKIRHWSAEDKLFASSVTDIITLAFRTSQRLEYEKYIKEQNRKIMNMNEVLEDRVKQRTEELENQNERLSEYAFINSHLLRAPLSRILGLINLIDHDKALKDSQLTGLLRKSGDELDQIIKKITDTLNDGTHLAIDQLRAKRNEDK